MAGIQTLSAIQDSVARTTSATNTAQIATLNASQTAQDALISASASQADLDAIKAANDKSIKAISVTATEYQITYVDDTTGTVARVSDAAKADQTALDAEIARATAAEASKEPLLPAGTPLQFLRRNAAGDGWETADIDVSPANLIAGPGVPGAAIGEDGFYYEQIDVALGVNDIWGPKAGGAWPAQADFKSADPEVSSAADLDRNSLDYPKPKVQSVEFLDDFLEDRQTPTSFRQEAGALDFTAIPDLRQNIRYFSRNTSKTTKLDLTLGTAGQYNIRRIASNGTESLRVKADGDTGTEIGPNEWAITEYNENGDDVEVFAFKAEFFVRLPTKPTGPMSVPYDVLVFIADTQQLWANVTGITEDFTGDETGNWKIIVGAKDVVFPGNNGPIIVGKKNFYYSNQSVPDPTTVVGTQGQELVIARASYPAGSDAATQAAGTIAETLWTRDVDEWVETANSGASLGSPITSAETILIDEDAQNNTFYAFINGDTYGQIKAKFPRFRFDLSASDSGVSRVARLSMVMTPAQLEETLSNSGALLANYNGVLISINTPTDTDTGFTYRQSSGDAPSGGRMQFTVTGLRDGILINNAESAVAGTYSLRKNADGTFDLV